MWQAWHEVEYQKGKIIDNKITPGNQYYYRRAKRTKCTKCTMCYLRTQ